MNVVVLMGRLTRDPDIRQSQGENPVVVARYTLAVDRRFAKDGQDKADFVSMISFGKTAEFIEKYVHKGTKLVVRGRIQTGSYINKDNVKVYTTDVVGEEVNFAESKKTSESQATESVDISADDGFVNVPDGINEELPFA